ncbi:MAG: NAD(P)-dependent oxidoreductase [Alcanivoracaceae bacterium]|nr:NAD(P)-dependent oxidoreductase [Alcanivoracaceae bacterium]
MTELVLVTGGTGFVGSQVVRSLLDSGARVRMLVRPNSSDVFASGSGVESVRFSDDLFAESDDWWSEVFSEIDTVIHLAWYAEPGKYLSSELNFHCLSGTLRMAKGAIRAGVRRFVGVGTCFEYDTAAGYLSVDTPLLPRTPYASCKAASYLSLSSWFALAGVEFLWCRLFYLYGEGEDSRRFVPYLRDRLESGQQADLTSGNQIRDYLDVAVAGKMIAEQALAGQQGAVNICSGVPVTIRQLAEQIAEEYGRVDLLNFGARPDNEYDPPCIVGVK